MKGWVLISECLISIFGATMVKLCSEQTIEQNADREPESNTRDIVLTEEGAKTVLPFFFFILLFGELSLISARQPLHCWSSQTSIKKEVGVTLHYKVKYKS